MRRPLLAVVLLLSATLLPAGTPPGAAGQPFLSGYFLIADPQVMDPRFAGTVILMLDHDEEGALGLVINRPLGAMPVAEVVAQATAGQDHMPGPTPEDAEILVHYGGPVEPETGFLVHSDDYNGPATLPSVAGIAITADVEVLSAIARGSGPARYLFAVGYAGWGPGQLEGELARGDWDTIPADPDLLFDADPASVWDLARKRRGIEL